ncbi:MAG: hypothetical protein HC902_06080 [Calothrix sp. SM1_5_4]|nr:hypothetical protein [Calothrix sp. SM1_5_4]
MRTLTGWPGQWRTYKGVEALPGFGRFGRRGIALVGFGGDVVMVSLRYTNNAKIWYEREATYPYEAYWEDLRIPGAPTRQSKRGVCWTDSMPKVVENNN